MFGKEYSTQRLKMFKSVTSTQTFHTHNQFPTKSKSQVRGANLVWQGHNVSPHIKNSSLVDKIIAFFKENFKKFNSIFKKDYPASESFSGTSNASDKPVMSPAKLDEVANSQQLQKPIISFRSLWKDSSAPVNIMKWDGTYQLHAAIRVGQKEHAKALLDVGADPSLRDCQGMTAYDYALLSKDKEMIKTLFPKKSADAYQKALELTEISIQTHLIQRNIALSLKRKLEALIQDRTNICKTNFSNVYKLLLNGNIDIYKLIKHSDVPSSEHHLTPLHCALLSKNENLVKIVIENCDPSSFLAKDTKGLTPLHYAAMLGLTESLELLLNLVKNTPGFNINDVDPVLQFSHANLAIASGHPQILALLCHNGVDLNYSPNGTCSPASLLWAHMEETDPLHVSTGQYILTAFNLLSLATEIVSPQATLGLMICSMMANGALYPQKGIKGQLFYWGGEAFSILNHMSLAQRPLIKACFDICRIASISIPCFKHIVNSITSLKYETGKAIKCGVVNGVSVGSTIYRLNNSIRYAQEAIYEGASFVRDVLTFNVRKRDELVGFHNKLVTKENSLGSSERRLVNFHKDLLRIIQQIHDEEHKLYTLWDYLNNKERSLIEREQLLQSNELNNILHGGENAPLAIESPYVKPENPTIHNVIQAADSPLSHTLQEVKQKMAEYNWTMPNWTYEADVMIEK